MAADLEAFLVAALPAVEAEAIHRHDDGVWMLDLPDGLFVQARVDAARAVLVLTTMLGVPVPGTELEAYRLLLEASGWWPVAGPLRMALDAEDGAALQITDVPLPGLDAAQLAGQLQTFVLRARHVQGELAQMAPPGMALPGDPASRVFAPDHFVRA